VVVQIESTPPPYPELVGLPAECYATNPISVDALIVKAPYQGVNIA